MTIISPPSKQRLSLDEGHQGSRGSYSRQRGSRRKPLHGFIGLRSRQQPGYTMRRRRSGSGHLSNTTPPTPGMEEESKDSDSDSDSSSGSGTTTHRVYSFLTKHVEAKALKERKVCSGGLSTIVMLKG